MGVPFSKEILRIWMICFETIWLTSWYVNLTTSLKIQTSVGDFAAIKLKLGIFLISKGPLKKIDCTIKTYTVNFFTHFSVLTSYFLSWPHFLFWVFINTSLSFFYFLTYIYINSFTINARYTLVSDFQVLHSI